MITMYRMSRIMCCAFVVLAFSLPPAASACARDPECGDASAWANFTDIVLKQSLQGDPRIVEWHGSFDHVTKDISFDTEWQGGASPERSSVAIVGGLAMLSKGPKLKPGYEIDSLDAPMLSTKLVMILLGRVFPKGPVEVVGEMAVDRMDSVGIRYATPSASGLIPAPWRLRGKVRKATDGNVSFDLTLSIPTTSSQPESNPSVVSMTGELGMLERPVFRDTDSLDGWTVYGVGPRVIKGEGGTVLDYGATPDEGSSYRTIGDIRAVIAAENHPGFRAADMDFTGFWKKECDLAFGLQIMHWGEEGKYSVVFCGPGGCGDPAETRLTFITGDKRWEVVSEDELVEIGRSGDRQTYHRCTRETRPVLKYRE